MINPSTLVTAASGMVDSDILVGRPYGGTAIMWSSKFDACVRRITSKNKLMSAIVFSLEGIKVLIMSIYAPCDYRRNLPSGDLLDLLGDIETVIDTSPHDAIMLAGDWNCDLSRQFAHWDAIRRFWLCVQCGFGGVLLQSTVRVTYVGPQGLSLIDHIVLTDNLTTSLVNYYAEDDDDVSTVNLSEHLPLCVSFALSTLSMLASAPPHPTSRVAFYKATNNDLARY